MDLKVYLGCKYFMTDKARDGKCQKDYVQAIFTFSGQTCTEIKAKVLYVLLLEEINVSVN